MKSAPERRAATTRAGAGTAPNGAEFRSGASGGFYVLLIPVLGFYLPLAFWICKAIGGDPAATAGPRTILPGDWEGVLWNTIYIAGGGALIATVLGSVAALLLESFAVRARCVLVPLLMIPLLLPASALSTTLTMSLGGGAFGFLVTDATGAVFLSAMQMAPLVLWGAARSLSGLPEAERSALRCALPPARAALRVLAPRLLPVASRLGLLVFLLLVPRMEAADYAGVETIGTRVLAAFTVRESDAEGWVLVALVTALVCALLAIAMRGLGTISPQALGDARAWDRDAVAPAAEAVLWGGAALAVWPLAFLAVQAWPFDGFTLRAWSGDLAAEFVRACAIAAILAVLGFWFAGARSRAAWLLFALPLFLPGSLPALAIASGVQEWIPQALYDTPLAMSVAQAVRFAGVALWFGILAREALPRAEHQAATAALAPARRMWRVELPRALPIIATAVLVTALLILGDVECALLLVPPGHGVPALELNQFLHFRYDTNAAQLALLLTGAAVTAALALARMGKGLR